MDHKLSPAPIPHPLPVPDVEEINPSLYKKIDAYVRAVIYNSLLQGAGRVPTYVHNADIIIKVRDGQWLPILVVQRNYDNST